VSEQGEQRTPAEEAHAAAAEHEAMAHATRIEGQARVEEVQRDVAETDVRRIEEEREEAEAEVEKLSRKERKARAKAEKEAQEALDARAKAQEAERQAHAAQRAAPDQPTETSTASIISPGVGSTTAPRAQAAASQAQTEPRAGYDAHGDGQTASERPEVLIGAAFAGAFLLARLIRAATSSDD
jgi:hypothetical protein